MKVYVVKRLDGKYLTEMMDFTDKLIFANLFVDVESAWAYAPNDCRVVECFLMERDERTDYTKQVRKEVCEKFVEQFILEYTMGNEPVEDIIYKVTNQMQGDNNE